MTDQAAEQAAEQAQGFQFGAGWAQDSADLGVIIPNEFDHARQGFAVLGEPATRAARIEAKRDREEAAAKAEVLSEELENRAWVLAKEGRLRSHPQVLTGTRWRTAEVCGCGYADVCRCPGLSGPAWGPAPTERPTAAGLRKVQSQRAASLTDGQREIDAMRKRLAQLESRVRSQGGGSARSDAYAVEGAGFRYR